MGFRNPITSLSVSQLLPGAIQGLWTLGNTAAAHAEIGTNAGGQSGIRLYGPDGHTVLINLDALTGDGTFTGDITGSTVTGSVVTGGTIETSAAGSGSPRLALESGLNRLGIYNAAGTLIGVLVGSGSNVTFGLVGGPGFPFLTFDAFSSRLHLTNADLAVDEQILDVNGVPYRVVTRGSTAVTGSATINHGLGATPTAVLAVVQSTLYRVATISSTPTNTSFNVTVWNPATSAADTSARTVNWIAVA